ncbi:MAG: hypothetical protein AAF253_05305 [Pseudomonadota bacterium]
MIRIALASASLITLAACASAPADTDPIADEPIVEVETAATDLTPVDDILPAEAEVTDLDLAMVTVSDLTAAGNEQAAIDRLTQMLGNPDLTMEQTGTILFERAKLRFGDGNDVMGAISDVDEMLTIAPDHPSAFDAAGLRDTARGEATSLNFALENGEFSTEERFNALFRLGNHQDAVDLMIDTNLTPDNAYLVDLYQMGVLCEGDEFSGRSYATFEPDGTERSLQFCDFGK